MTRVSVRLLVWCYIAAIAPFCALAKFCEWAVYSNRFAARVRVGLERLADQHGVMM